MPNKFMRASFLLVIAVGVLIATVDAHVTPQQSGRLVVVNESNESAQIQVRRGENFVSAGAVGPRTRRTLSVSNGEVFRALVLGQPRGSHTVTFRNGEDTWVIR